MAPFRIDFYQPITFPTSYKISVSLKTKKIYNFDDFFKKIKSTSAFFCQKSFRPSFNIISLIKLPYRNKLDLEETQQHSP